MLLKISLTLLAAVLVPRFAYAETITYDTSGVVEGTLGPFGLDDFTFGQTFDSPANNARLKSFSLFLCCPEIDEDEFRPLKVRGYVGEWDGSKVSRLLFESSTQIMTASDHFQEFAFTPDVALARAGTYVAFLSTANVGPQREGAGAFRMPFRFDDLIAGGFAGTRGSGRSTWFRPWDDAIGSGSDMWFKARITDGFAPTPEPESLTLLGVGAMLAAMHARSTANSKRKND